jgi:hypothetical protein
MSKWIVGLVLFGSVALNCYQAYQVQKFDQFQRILIQKDQLLSSGYSEIAIGYLEKIKDTQEEIIKNQGRVEGILSVVHNFTPDANLHSSVWHDGYNRGGSTKEYAIETAYKNGYHKATEDLKLVGDEQKEF